VQVLDVERGSPAWSSGLRTGDIIIAVNQRDVSSADDVMATAGRGSDTLLLNIIRGNDELMLVIQ
jgi:S1-C subfamily serine protease